MQAFLDKVVSLVTRHNTAIICSIASLRTGCRGVGLVLSTLGPFAQLRDSTGNSTLTIRGHDLNSRYTGSSAFVSDESSSRLYGHTGQSEQQTFSITEA